MKKFFAALIAATLVTFGAQTQAADYPSADEVAVKVANSGGTVFPVGQPNVNYEKYFTGQTYLCPLSTKDSINVANVTFIDGAHTYWHIHHGTCQILVTGALERCSERQRQTNWMQRHVATARLTAR